MSLIPILLVLLLFVVVLLMIFSFKLLLVDFGGHFLSSFPVYLSSRLLLTSRLAKLCDRRSAVSVELVVIPTKLIEPILVEEIAIRIYERSVLVDVETILVVLASWRISFLVVLLLFQVLACLILLSGIL